MMFFDSPKSTYDVTMEDRKLSSALLINTDDMALSSVSTPLSSHVPALKLSC